MKILHIITSLKVGGAESSLVSLLSNLDLDENEHVVAYFYAGANVSKIKDLGINTYHIKGLVSPYDPLGIYRLFRYVHKCNPDLIHSALWSANIFGSFVAKFFKIPLVSDLHGDVEDHGAIRNFFERFTKNIPQRYIAVANSVADSFREKIGEAKIKIIPNGIDSNKIRNRGEGVLLREDIGLPKNAFVVGTVGRLVSIKSYDLLIKAFKKFSNKHEKGMALCLVGDGPDMANLKKLSNSLGVSDRVYFMGNQDCPEKFYPLFDCFVLSSKSEGMSIAMLEALSFGLPVITTVKGQSHDVIVDGVNGFLIPSGNIDSLVSALCKVFENSEQIVLMRKQNVKYVDEKFNIRKMTKQYEELYNEVIGKKSW
ncbi:glycosyltransferase [Candidatus Babeliales bacterium]|nr:glycosyltransferase [Candidatus Babeliales bacterium]